MKKSKFLNICIILLLELILWQTYCRACYIPKTSLTLKDTGNDKEQITRATIGEGVIEVAQGSDLTGLNRDTTKAQEITKDMTTGALDATAAIDNRVFTSEGRADIAEQHEKLGENLSQIGKQLQKSYEKLKQQQLLKLTQDAELDNNIKSIKPKNVNNKEDAIKYMINLNKLYDELTDEEKSHLKYIMSYYSLTSSFMKYKYNQVDKIVSNLKKDKLFLNSIKNYEKLTFEEQKILTKNIVNEINLGLGFNNLNIEFEENDSAGSYNPVTDTLKINPNNLNNFIENMDTVAHEIIGHRSTYKTVENNKKPDNMSNIVWQDFRYSYTNMESAYIYLNDEYNEHEYELYRTQPSEKEAWAIGSYFSNQINKLKETSNGENK